MKEISLLFNSSKPEIHYLISAGQSIDIQTPGIYNVVPLNLENIIAGFQPKPALELPTVVNNLPESSKSILELNQPAVPREITIQGGKIDTLFTQNLSQLLIEARQK